MTRVDVVGEGSAKTRGLSIILIYTYLITRNTRYIYYALNNIDHVQRQSMLPGLQDQCASKIYEFH